MKISVLITLYNGKEFLMEQLESVCNQTVRADEVVLCDDGSNDGTVQLVKQFIQERDLEDSWRIYENERNMGYAENFYNGVSYTHGDCILFCDQDDIWMENKIEENINIMSKNEEIALLCTEYEPYICSKDAPVIPQQFMQYMKGDGSLERLELNHKTIFIGSEGCVMCVRRSFFDKIAPYHFENWAHDEFVWKLALAQGGCYFYHKPLIKRRMHSSNVSKQKMHKMEKRVLFLEKLLLSHEKMLEYGKTVGLHAEEVELIQKNIESVKLRLELLKNKKYCNTLKLFCKYRKNYPSMKSIPMELVMAMRG